MGRRAKKAPVQTKKKITLAKRFKCPFCANENVVECKMDRRAGVGSLACRLCGASYQMPIHHLHEPIDVFSEWLDDCEAAERGTTNPDAAAAAYDNDHGHHNDDDVLVDDDEVDDIDLNAPPAFESKKKSDGGGRKLSKGSSKAAGSSTTPQPSYETLGLDDSDDDE
mmetsp:Transcript_33141/g.50683  ORF Transcript_33141/g.50683 Transcript_33141/m.50683 type:complete len:167 (+) Transcript_33141:149-649(+)